MDEMIQRCRNASLACRSVRSPDSWRRALAGALFGAAVLVLAGCGGGGSGSGGSSVVATGGIIGGTGFKGPVAHAAVSAYAIADGTIGKLLGSGTTDTGGRFSVAIGDHAGPVLMQLSGGSYVDEATGSVMAMAGGDVLTAVLPNVGAGEVVAGLQLTPVTSMAQAAAARMAGGMTAANIATANAALGSYFTVGDILRTAPMDPLQPGSGTAASAGEMNYGMVLAALSQYARSQGMAASSAMVTAMMGDASDGVMNGRMGAVPIAMAMGGMMGHAAMPANAGTSGLGGALSAFLVSAQNRSGVTPAMMAPLINQLNASNGDLFPGMP